MAVLNKKKEIKFPNIVENNIIFGFSPHIFWNCDITKLDYKRNKKIIIERIIEYGKESDEILMWKIYKYNDIKKIAINDINLNRDKIMYMSFVLNIPEKYFKSYGKKQWFDALEGNI